MKYRYLIAGFVSIAISYLLARTGGQYEAGSGMILWHATSSVFFGAGGMVVIVGSFMEDL